MILANKLSTKKYGNSFPRPTQRLGIDRKDHKDLNDGVVCVKTKTTHEVKRNDWILYTITEKATVLFLSEAVPKMYLLVLYKGPPIFISDVYTIYQNATGEYKINILALWGDAIY
jgi:hypothetical protein